VQPPASPALALNEVSRDEADAKLLAKAPALTGLRAGRRGVAPLDASGAGSPVLRRRGRDAPRCQFSADALVIGVGQGVGNSPYLLDNEGASGRADDAAERAAIVNAELVLGLAPCKRCGHRPGLARFWVRNALGAGLLAAFCGGLWALLERAHFPPSTLVVCLAGAAGFGVAGYLSWLTLSTAPDRVRFLEPAGGAAAGPPKRKKKKKKRAPSPEAGEGAEAAPPAAPDAGALAGPAQPPPSLDADGVAAVLALIRFGIVKHGPAITSARPRGAFELGAGHRAYLLGDVESRGAIPYAWLFAVFADGAAAEPVLVVSAEGKTSSLGAGSHFLVVTDEDNRANLGASDEWADMNAFLRQAATVAAARLGAELPAELASN
jgi:hypothetical protein